MRSADSVRGFIALRSAEARSAADSEDYVAWAQDALEDGLETPALLRLAIQEPPFFAPDLKRLFEKAVEELGLEEPVEPLPQPALIFKLQRFWNQCRECGLRFDTYVDRAGENGVVYDNGHGRRRYLDSAKDSVWNEVKALIAQENLPAASYETQDAYLFHAALARTVDPPADGPPFGNAWDKTPCPRCGSLRRIGFGPVDPPEFADVEIEPATHIRWDSLTADEKKAIVRQVIAEVRPAKGDDFERERGGPNARSS